MLVYSTFSIHILHINKLSSKSIHLLYSIFILFFFFNSTHFVDFIITIILSVWVTNTFCISILNALFFFSSKQNKKIKLTQWQRMRLIEHEFARWETKKHVSLECHILNTEINHCGSKLFDLFCHYLVEFLAKFFFLCILLHLINYYLRTTNWQMKCSWIHF